MANEHLTCTFGNCMVPGFFRVENLRDDVSKIFCREHWLQFLVEGLNKAQQAAYKEQISRMTGYQWKF